MSDKTGKTLQGSVHEEVHERDHIVGGKPFEISLEVKF